jgi:hypothetical protein
MQGIFRAHFACQNLKKMQLSWEENCPHRYLDADA